jgi:hypothetical protein
MTRSLKAMVSAAMKPRYPEDASCKPSRCPTVSTTFAPWFFSASAAWISRWSSERMSRLLVAGAFCASLQACTAFWSVALPTALLGKAEVDFVPGISFGKDETVRLSHATDLETIKARFDRSEQFFRTI